ncbi:SDR family NAD(P)-dependent oxidoreductase [Ligilactobacillus pobuzihii]|uniref:SDR family NAD(P)-dependent oxidoreductase n=1 Tax=Ligilactobacillus pobuzihii TaxID=449659 RepID=UPI0019D26066|nr:SDR family oxidoreductase [Ligilactobacillus pobuzihii]MBN7275638.1 SDR family NAD(P)-dependent oxidoreductase [Ligilactobacillus pobuzihii]
MTGYQELKSLRNRIVLVTGASSGLGEQVAYQAALKKAIVIVCARRKDRLEKVAEVCRKLSGRLSLAYELDVSDPAQIEHVVNEVESSVGPIDVLVNNAGFGLMENAVDFPMDIAEKMFRVNVLGMMYMTKYTALQMAERQRGAIINVASIAAKIQTPKSAVYSASKAAVLAYSNALRLEVKELGISVLTVNPGPIQTHFFDFADRTGHYLDNISSFVLDPEVLAAKIVNTIGTGKRELNRPLVMEAAYHAYQLFPRVGDFLTSTLFNKK